MKDLFKPLLKWSEKHASGILTFLCVTGVGTTAYLSAVATPKAIKKLDARKEELGVDDLTLVEKIKVGGPCYIPTALSGVTTSLCAVGAHKIDMERNIALTAAYSLAENASRRLIEQTKNVVGEKSQSDIKQAVAKQILDENPYDPTNVIATGHGDDLVFDTGSGRYFRADRVWLENAENKFNYKLREGAPLPLNELYSEIGIQEIGFGEKLGWDIEKGYWKMDLTPEWTSDGSSTCIVMTYDVIPLF